MAADRRSLAALVATALLALPLAGCSDDAEGGGPGTTDRGGEPDDPPGEVKEPAADFTAQVEVGASAITVDYTLTNTSGGELLVVNRLPVPAGAGTRYPTDHAYVTGQGDGRVQIAQRAFSWPDSTRVNWEQAPRVGVTRLADGDSVSATVEVPLPLTRSQPFGDDLGYGTIELPDPAETAVFCLGVLSPPYEKAVALTSDDGVTTLAHGDAASAGQHLFCSDEVDL